MKRIIEGILRVCLIALIVIPYFLPIAEVNAASRATTVRGLRSELASLQAERTRLNNARAKTESEINSSRRETENAFNEKETAARRVVELEEEIKASEIEITRLSKETDELMRWFEISKGNNAYIEYIANATSMTDLLVRTAVVEQLTKHNNETMNNLKELIERNIQLQEQLRLRNIELENRIQTLRGRIDALGRERARLLDVGEDINAQIRNQQNLIEWYSRFCSEDQQFRDCVPVLESAGWMRPLVNAFVSSDFGWRVHPIHGDRRFHNGVDLGAAEGTSVFAPANGRVAAVTVRSSCGGNRVYIHHIVGGRAFTTDHTHLLDFTVKVGDIVTANTIIGRVGGRSTATRNGGYDACTTGAHLHYGKATGHYLIDYSSLSTYAARGIKPAGFGGTGFRFTSRHI